MCLVDVCFCIYPCNAFYFQSIYCKYIKEYCARDVPNVIFWHQKVLLRFFIKALNVCHHSLLCKKEDKFLVCYKVGFLFVFFQICSANSHHSKPCDMHDINMHIDIESMSLLGINLKNFKLFSAALLKKNGKISDKHKELKLLRLIIQLDSMSTIRFDKRM